MSPPPLAPQPSSRVEQCRSAALSPVDSAQGLSLPNGLSKWFTEEVHPHGAQLRSYLRGAFPSVHDVDDVVQESYLRIWRARAAQPIGSVKSFLFQIARHLAIDLVRRRQVSPIEPVGDLARLPVIEERADVIESVSAHDKVRLLVEALATLPPRCREVVMLRKLKGLSQKEAAARLQIAEKTVDEHLARGVKRLEDYFRRRGISGLYEQ